MYKLRKNLFLLIIIICAFQFSFFGVFEPIYSILRLFIIIITLLLFFSMGLHKVIYVIKTKPIITFHVIVSVVFLVIAILYFGIGFVVDFSVVRDPLVVLGILVISLSLEYNSEEIKRMYFLYSVLFLLSILSIIFFLGSGFQILDLYLPVPKNQLGPGYAMGGIVSFYMIFNDKKRRKFYLILFGLYIVSLLVLRARATVLGIFITCAMLLFFELRQYKKVQIWSFFLVIIAVLFGFDFIYNALFKNFDTTDINSLSTGRMDRNIKGLEFLNDNLFIGEAQGISYGGLTIHNYVLKNIVAFGIIAALPIVLLYFRYFLYIIKNILAKPDDNIWRVGYYLVFLLFFVSQFEYTFPFSPVSATFFAFFVLGQNLKKTNK